MGSISRFCRSQLTMARFLHLFLLLAGLWVTAAQAALTNQLANHPSPYLALHGSDPVAWQDWSAQALTVARKEKKLLYVSVGYFSCHWCHVMQRESYKNERIAAILNKYFVPVKVDRELEPALDTRLIEFAESTQGRAGWPLNAFLTPDGYPLYTVLYLPPQNFEKVLQRLNKLWQQDHANLTKLARNEAVASLAPAKPELSAKLVERYTQTILKTTFRIADTLNGGFGNQNKFPSAPQLEFLLRHYELNPDPRVKDFLILTLGQMANRGLYDHIGHGFFRYTVDPSWETPHFEKMLYDNAQLARLYLRAGRLFNRKDYEQVARNTLDFMIQDMAAQPGAMVASFSAVDDKDVEGGYYLWSDDQLQALLTEQEQKVTRLVWQMTDKPPFDVGYLPMRGADHDEIAKQLQLTSAQVQQIRTRANVKLLQARVKRVLPTDTKLLAGWNGLALTSLAEAARILNERRYRDAANSIRRYLMETLWDGRQLKRAVAKDRAVGQVSIEDYAYVAEGLLAWAMLTGDSKDYESARNMVENAWRRFHHNGGWRLSERTLLAAESVRSVISDGPMPSPPAVITWVTLRLTEKEPDSPLRRQALSALNSGHDVLGDNPFWFASQVGSMVLGLQQAQ